MRLRSVSTVIKLVLGIRIAVLEINSLLPVIEGNRDGI